MLMKIYGHAEKVN